MRYKLFGNAGSLDPNGSSVTVAELSEEEIPFGWYELMSADTKSNS